MSFEGFIGNSQLYDEMYAKYRRDPNSVPVSWQKVFASFDKQEITFEQPSAAASDVRVYKLIEAYRKYGHLYAKVNPIALKLPEEPQELRLETYRLSPDELSKVFPTYGVLPKPEAPLLEIVNALKETYCSTVGIEYVGFLEDPEIENWLQQRIETTRFKSALTIEQKQKILESLNKSELFEAFLHTKYIGQKRFSLEGGETLIPMLEAVLETGTKFGMEACYIGMAHRGRLNVLSNILQKSFKEVFEEFEEIHSPDSFEGSGDVKYHKGYSSTITTPSGHTVQIEVAHNPSHLESIGAVVEGEVYASQLAKKDDLKEKVVPILVHGDAALSGQGSVYETLQMSKLKGYTTGGTVHFVINNQIGFTTLPEDGRSTRYCTDIAKTFGAPVFHVNAEDPDGCVYAANLAIELRQRFHCDVFIDLNCYRKYGHNETDEPAFTQPLEYQMIRAKKPIRVLYRESLINQGVLEKFMAESLENEFKTALQQALHTIKVVQTENTEKKDYVPPPPAPVDLFKVVQTAVPLDKLKQIAKKCCEVPPDIHLHPKVQQLLKDRWNMVEGSYPDKQVDWGMAETLAYATLLWDGTTVRLAGQDSARGTFSHRHALWMDQAKEFSYYPLSHLKEGQGLCEIINSHLSEMAALGFEYGYSLINTQALVIWEAQFGDFCNGAQVIIDQFIAAGEQKWGQKSSLTMFLPHGYEGQGPEHSSGRIERFLSLAGNDNIQVVYPTTPAQMFHLLRKQALRTLKKPLIVFTPKGLLRHPACQSPLAEFSQGYFQEILDDPTPPKIAKSMYFCSGRFFYDLLEEREKSKVEDMAIIRIEQLYPLNGEKLKNVIDKYKGVEDYTWVQEEPSNMGAWEFMRSHMRGMLPEGKELLFIGRPRSASTAVGSHALHKKQHTEIMNAIFEKHRPSIFQIARHFKA